MVVSFGTPLLPAPVCFTAIRFGWMPVPVLVDSPSLAVTGREPAIFVCDGCLDILGF